MTVNHNTPIPGAVESAMRKVKDLKPYPLQEIQAPRPAAEERAFEESIRANGIQDPVDIMPAGNAAGLPGNTVVDGHRRVEAARKLKILHVATRVRHDWVGLTLEELNVVFLRINTDRRNLAPVELAYMFFKLNAIQTGKAEMDFEDMAAKVFVAERMDVDLRTVSRYARLFKTPTEIRTAVARGHLPLVVGEKVTDLSAAAQEKLAAKVAQCNDGAQVADIVRQALPNKATTPGRAGGVAARRLKVVVAGLRELASVIDHVDHETLSGYLPHLEQGRESLAALIRRAQTKKDSVTTGNTTTTKGGANIEPAHDLDAEDFEFDEAPDIGFPNE